MIWHKHFKMNFYVKGWGELSFDCGISFVVKKIHFFCKKNNYRITVFMFLYVLKYEYFEEPLSP